MEQRRITFDRPDRFVAGATGAPEARSFFVQVRHGSTLATLGVDETLLLALTLHLSTVLDDLSRIGDRQEPEVVLDVAPLDLPLFPLFDVGSLRVAFDQQTGLVRVELVDVGPDPDVVEVTLSLPMARRFCARARLVVRRGEPPCPFCSQPVSPDGHLCPRRDGLRALKNA